jgi:hypothetical protein
MIDRFASRMLAAGLCTALVATPLLAEKASNLTWINGQDAASAERELRGRGFTNISSHRSSGGYVNSYWWNGGDDDCIVVESYSGKVMTINDATDQDCGHHKGDGAAAAVGVVAGAAILGALLGGKSHHKEGRDYNSDQTAEFDRGYTDGLHGATYHNYSRSDAYSHGYEKGVDEREANLSHHYRRGGYAQVARIDDLQGARAAGGMSELERRGFTQVDKFATGNTRYSIQWKRDTRQCVQVTIADGRFYDIRDIGTHPNCR